MTRQNIILLRRIYTRQKVTNSYSKHGQTPHTGGKLQDWERLIAIDDEEKEELEEEEEEEEEKEEGEKARSRARVMRASAR